MALYDVMFEFSDAQSIFSATATKAASNVIDMQASDLEMGAGEPIWLNIRVTTAFAGAGTATFKLVCDTDATMDSSSIEIIQTEPFAITDIDAVGDWIYRGPLPNDFDRERYVGLVCTCSGAMTAGSIDAWLDHGPQSSFDTAWLDHGPQSSFDTQVSTSNI
jgi:hypothetical protein